MARLSARRTIASICPFLFVMSVCMRATALPTEPERCWNGTSGSTTSTDDFALHGSTRCPSELVQRAVSPTANPSRWNVFVWRQACGDFLSLGGNADENCRADANTCPPRMSRYALLTQVVSRAQPKPTGSWTVVETGCYPNNPGSTTPFRQVTSVDVLTALHRVGLPQPAVDGPRYTLVNLETTFYVKAASFTRSFRLLGQPVTAEVAPVTYTWHWGDGAMTTTTTPGRPYPAKDVTHTYAHRTNGGAQREVGVVIEWRCRFKVANGDWQSISDTITTQGTPARFPIREASAVLIPN